MWIHAIPERSMITSTVFDTQQLQAYSAEKVLAMALEYFCYRDKANASAQTA